VQNWGLEFYESVSDRQPVVEYLESLSDQEAARVRARLLLSMPYVRPIDGTPLWELRVVGRIHHRVFYVAVHERRFVLLHAFTKKTQRTPSREIRTAIQRLSDYQERFGA
jgi:phage-related protein